MQSDASPLNADMRRVVAAQGLAFVATVGADGAPNLSPKGSIRVLDDDHLVFADIRSPATIRNLEANPAIEINVVDPIVRRGYRFRGAGQVLRAVLQDVVFAELVSPAYDAGASEQELRVLWRERHGVGG